MTENMKRFLEHLDRDKTLQKELEKCAEQQRQERRQRAIDLAGKAGISLTDEDFDSMGAGLPEGPVSDKSLEAVTGGCWPMSLSDFWHLYA